MTIVIREFEWDDDNLRHLDGLRSKPREIDRAVQYPARS